MANKVKQILTGWQSSWILLAQAGIWVLGIVAGFLLPPPVGAEADAKVWVRFAQFVVTVGVGLVLLAALRWQRKKDTLRWATLSGLMLVLATVAFFGYQMCLARWTVPYHNDSGRVVVGFELNDFGRRWKELHPERTLYDIVMDARGEVDTYWTRESLNQRRLALAALYVLTMPLLMLCIIATVQAIRCAAPDKPSRRRTRRAKGPDPRFRPTHSDKAEERGPAKPDRAPTNHSRN